MVTGNRLDPVPGDSKRYLPKRVADVEIVRQALQDVANWLGFDTPGQYLAELNTQGALILRRVEADREGISNVSARKTRSG